MAQIGTHRWGFYYFNGTCWPRSCEGGRCPTGEGFQSSQKPDPSKELGLYSQATSPGGAQCWNVGKPEIGSSYSVDPVELNVWVSACTHGMDRSG